MPGLQDNNTPLHIAVTIDVNDLESQARFWSELLGVEVSHIGEPYASLPPAEGRKISLWLQRVPETKTGKNRVHLDFVVADLDVAEQRIVQLGGTLGDRHTWESYEWRTCHDPEGNEFDVMLAQQPPEGD